MSDYLPESFREIELLTCDMFEAAKIGERALI